MDIAVSLPAISQGCFLLLEVTSSCGPSYRQTGASMLR